MLRRVTSIIATSTLLLAACSQSPRTPAPAAIPAAATVKPPTTFPELAKARSSGRLDLYEAGLKEVIGMPDEANRARALAMLALFYEEQKRPDEAIDSLLQASNSNRDIAPFLGVHLMDALAARGRFGEAISIANQIVGVAPGTAASVDARLTLPALYARAGDAARSATALTQASDIPLDEFTERRMVLTADALASSRASSAATAIRQKILLTRPQGRYTEKLYDQLINSSEAPLLQLEFGPALDLADRLGRVNRYDQALDFLDRIATKYPKESASAYFRYVRQRSLFNSRNYDQASAIRIEAEESYYLPSQLLRARAFWRNKQNQQFLQLTNSVIGDAPSSKEATEARLLLGKYYVTDETDYDKATKFLEQAIAAGARGDEGENIWTLGWTYLIAGRADEALRTFDQYLAAYPDNDYTSNALFWSGKIYEKRGDTVRRDTTLRRLIDFYPYSYYSYRARAILGLPLTAPTEVATAKPFPSLDVAEPHETEVQLAVVHKLLDVGLQPEAARELKNVTAAAPDDPVLAFRMAELYSVAGEPLKAMGILQKRFRDTLRHGASGVPHRFWEILYPRGYWSEIQNAAGKAKLDPYLVASIIRQESAFDPTVVSNAGAVGLMQIMPPELGRITADAGLPPATRADLFDPRRNTEVGAAEFRQKLGRVNDNQILAIGAYNAGEEAVGRWIAKTPIDDVDVFIESIPYAETRLYVKSVTRNLYEYRRIYEEPPASTSTAMATTP